ncbi:MAG: hypothetical protein CMI34_00145 [Opitutales bacterium]|nr:hypothetical protein [Opitutales bacterium]|tara:strand:- start:446 stop:634 length:189 start_codon:yes stop_codon:yes gene_type:complete
MANKYTFSVPCEYIYTISANSVEDAKQLLIKEGGLSIDGKLSLEEDNYKQAELLGEEVITDD